MSPEEIARELGGEITGDSGLFDSLPAATYFKCAIEDQGLQAGEPMLLRSRYLVPFAEESACPVCGGVIYFDFPSRHWGHPLYSRFPWYPIRYGYGRDSVYFNHMREEFRDAYYKVPDGYTWQQVRDHTCRRETDSCEICARSAYGCLKD